MSRSWAVSSLFSSLFPLSDKPCTSAGLFTTNVFAAPPVVYDKKLLASNGSGVRGVVINTRVANACTGDEGTANAVAFSKMAEDQLKLGSNTMYNMSTGVIGAQLPVEKLERGVAGLVKSLGSTNDHWERAAQGMLTTDTKAKHGFLESSDGYSLGGCIKGTLFFIDSLNLCTQLKPCHRCRNDQP